MRIGVRILLAAVTWVGVLFFGALAAAVAIPDPPVRWVRGAVVLLLASFAAGLVWVGSRPGASRSRGTIGLARAVVVGALVAGSVGFLGGFIGAPYVWPESNLAPLYGFIVSGPVGVLVGAIGGAVHWFIKRR